MRKTTKARISFIMAQHDFTCEFWYIAFDDSFVTLHFNANDQQLPTMLLCPDINYTANKKYSYELYIAALGEPNFP